MSQNVADFTSMLHFAGQDSGKPRLRHLHGTVPAMTGVSAAMTTFPHDFALTFLIFLVWCWCVVCMLFVYKYCFVVFAVCASRLFQEQWTRKVRSWWFESRRASEFRSSGILQLREALTSRDQRTWILWRVSNIFIHFQKRRESLL